MHCSIVDCMSIRSKRLPSSSMRAAFTN
jgi:hypothetical protein